MKRFTILILVCLNFVVLVAGGAGSEASISDLNLGDRVRNTPAVTTNVSEFSNVILISTWGLNPITVENPDLKAIPAKVWQFEFDPTKYGCFSKNVSSITFNNEFCIENDLTEYCVSDGEFSFGPIAYTDEELEDPSWALDEVRRDAKYFGGTGSWASPILVEDELDNYELDQVIVLNKSGFLLSLDPDFSQQHVNWSFNLREWERGTFLSNKEYRSNPVLSRDGETLYVLGMHRLYKINLNEAEGQMSDDHSSIDWTEFPLTNSDVFIAPPALDFSEEKLYAVSEGGKVFLVDINDSSLNYDMESIIAGSFCSQPKVNSDGSVFFASSQGLYKTEISSINEGVNGNVFDQLPAPTLIFNIDPVSEFVGTMVSDKTSDLYLSTAKGGLFKLENDTDINQPIHNLLRFSDEYISSYRSFISNHNVLIESQSENKTIISTVSNTGSIANLNNIEDDAYFLTPVNYFSTILDFYHENYIPDLNIDNNYTTSTVSGHLSLGGSALFFGNSAQALNMLTPTDDGSIIIWLDRVPTTEIGFSPVQEATDPLYNDVSSAKFCITGQNSSMTKKASSVTINVIPSEGNEIGALYLNNFYDISLFYDEEYDRYTANFTNLPLSNNYKLNILDSDGNFISNCENIPILENYVEITISDQPNIEVSDGITILEGNIGYGSIEVFPGGTLEIDGMVEIYNDLKLHEGSSVIVNYNKELKYNQVLLYPNENHEEVTIQSQGLFVSSNSTSEVKYINSIDTNQFPLQDEALKLNLIGERNNNFVIGRISNIRKLIINEIEGSSGDGVTASFSSSFNTQNFEEVEDFTSSNRNKVEINSPTIFNSEVFFRYLTQVNINSSTVFNQRVRTYGETISPLVNIAADTRFVDSINQIDSDPDDNYDEEIDNYFITADVTNNATVEIQTSLITDFSFQFEEGTMLILDDSKLDYQYTNPSFPNNFTIEFKNSLSQIETNNYLTIGDNLTLTGTSDYSFLTINETALFSSEGNSNEISGLTVSGTGGNIIGLYINDDENDVDDQPNDINIFTGAIFTDASLLIRTNEGILSAIARYYFTDCTFSNTDGTSFIFKGELFDDDKDEISFSNCTFENGQTGIYAVNGAEIEIMNDCNFSNHSRSSVNILGRSTLDVSGSIFTNSSIGIMGDNFENVTIEGNTLQNCEEAGIALFCGYQEEGANEISYSEITSNEISYCGTGLYLMDVSVNLTANEIHDNNRHGIEACRTDGQDEAGLIENQIYNNGGAEILTESVFMQRLGPEGESDKNNHIYDDEYEFIETPFPIDYSDMSIMDNYLLALYGTIWRTVLDVTGNTIVYNENQLDRFFPSDGMFNLPDPIDSRTVFESGVADYDNGNFDSALYSFDTVISQFPESVYIYNSVHYIYYISKNLNQPEIFRDRFENWDLSDKEFKEVATYFYNKTFMDEKDYVASISKWEIDLQDPENIDLKLTARNQAYSFLQLSEQRERTENLKSKYRPETVDEYANILTSLFAENNDNENSVIVAPKLTLSGNYPNPFNPETSINFSIPETGKVTIDIFNIKGQKVRRLIDGIREKGLNTIIWKGENQNNRQVSTGVYFYKVKYGKESAVKKMLLLK